VSFDTIHDNVRPRFSSLNGIKRRKVLLFLTFSVKEGRMSDLTFFRVDGSTLLAVINVVRPFTTFVYGTTLWLLSWKKVVSFSYVALSHRCKGISPSPANLHRVKRSYVAVMTFYRDHHHRCIDVVRYDLLLWYVAASSNVEERLSSQHFISSSIATISKFSSFSFFFSNILAYNFFSWVWDISAKNRFFSVLSRSRKRPFFTRASRYFSQKH